MAVAKEQLNPILGLATELLQVRDELERTEERTKLLKGKKGKIESQMVDMMVNDGLEKFSHMGKSFYPTVKTHASILVEDRDLAHEWFKTNGYGDLVKESVNAQTLTSWVKEQQQEGDGIPEDLEPLLSIYETTAITVRKG